MSKIIAVSTGKGGGGKSTTAWHIGAGLRKHDKKVLIVDLDPQQHISKWLLGADLAPGTPTISELIYAEVSKVMMFKSFGDCILKSREDDLDFIPSNKMLSGMLNTLASDPDSVNVLSRIFRNEYFSLYDYIILDCAPAFDLLVTNAFRCCDKLLIPVQADYPCYEGIPDILEKLISSKGSPHVENYIEGFLVTMYDSRANIPNEVYNAVKESYGALAFETPVPYLQEVKRCVDTGVSIVNNPRSKAGIAYMNAVERILS